MVNFVGTFIFCLSEVHLIYNELETFYILYGVSYIYIYIYI